MKAGENSGCFIRLIYRSAAGNASGNGKKVENPRKRAKKTEAGIHRRSNLSDKPIKSGDFDAIFVQRECALLPDFYYTGVSGKVKRGMKKIGGPDRKTDLRTGESEAGTRREPRRKRYGKNRRKYGEYDRAVRFSRKGKAAGGRFHRRRPCFSAFSARRRIFSPDMRRVIPSRGSARADRPRRRHCFPDFPEFPGRG